MIDLFKKEQRGKFFIIMKCSKEVQSFKLVITTEFLILKKNLTLDIECGDICGRRIAHFLRLQGDNKIIVSVRNEGESRVSAFRNNFTNRFEIELVEIRRTYQKICAPGIVSFDICYLLCGGSPTYLFSSTVSL